MKKAIFSFFMILGGIPLFAEEEGVSKGLEVWTLMGFFKLGLILLLLGFILHIASLYYSRTLNSFKIRLSGENFGIVFVLVRDLSLFAAFGIGALLINPDIFGDVKLALPFVPLGTVLLGFALYIKLSKDIEADWSARKLFIWLLTAAAFLQYFGFIFIMESAPESWVETGKAGNFWLFLRSMRSNINPSLSMWTFYICFPLVVVIFIMLLSVGLSKSKWEKGKKELEKK